MFTIKDGRDSFYQWDTGRKIVVSDAEIDQVHFANALTNGAYVVDIANSEAEVPDILLRESYDIQVYGFDKNFTKYAATFKVHKRPKPEEYIYTPDSTYDDIFVKKEDLEKYLEGYTPDLTSYVKKTELTNYATKDDLANIHVDTSQFATKEEVAAVKASIPSTTGLVNESELTKYALKTDIPSTSGFATKTELDSYALKTEIPDTSQLATKAELKNYALKSDIPAYENAEDKSY